MNLNTIGKSFRMVEDVFSGKRITNLILTILSPILFLLASGIPATLINILIGFTIFNINPFLKSNAENTNFNLISMIINTGFVILAVFLWVKFYEKRNLKTLGFYKKNAFNKYLIGFFFGFLMLALSALIIVITCDVEITPGTLTFSRMFPFLLVILAWLIQGASEEILLRGFMLPILSKRFGIWTGILGNSIIFAALHLLNPGIAPLAILNLILFGIFASLYTIYSGSLWGACALHSAWNFTQGNIFGFLVSGTHASGDIVMFINYKSNNLINGGTFGPEGGLTVSLLLILASILLIKLIKKNESNK
ncbi:hypothetical protein SAMN02745163_00860 [Clostridium cavendishii DSM 21758]|uniref:CAAX prenyl protease 2/Lysostaphin resistance protein A-like domain-containing protein n=1 Tax=Clostridium cavendishii DSM 21758 TaxID=1121302 RepID=A0A1M6EIC5_9CLOT|nr:type II CAAX endopeptidase family protein [Clostridium cavendishii]SHI85201.1 hypothetical protein SAMN02745163_00860 [Clostridium cavendishii DSM 21758]